MKKYRLTDFRAFDEPLRAALAECRDGGEVIVPPGDWLSGPVDIPSETTLRLQPGAVVRFRDDPAVYPPVFTRWEGVECHGYQPLMRIRNGRNVRIIGDGVFDGSGTRWWDTYRRIRRGELDPAEVPGVPEILERNTGGPTASGGGGRSTGYLRPPLLQVNSSRDVVLEGPTFRNSPFWTAHILYSRHVIIRSCRFSNPPDSPNTDGLNIDSSSDVEVVGCGFDVGDDCLCLKSGSDDDGRRVNRPTEDVSIRNCRMLRGHGGIVFGSEISGGVRNIDIHRCELTGTDRGIRIKSRRGRGGYVRDVRIRDIRMRDVRFPLVINSRYRCGITPEETAVAASAEPLEICETTPVVDNVTISGVRADGVRTAVSVLGLPESPVRSLVLTDWDVSTAPDPSGEPGMPAMDFDDTAVSVSGIHARHVAAFQVGPFRLNGRDIRTTDIDADTACDF